MMTRAAAPLQRRMLPLWAGMLGPPIIWATQFGASYVLVPYACVAGALTLLYATTFVSLTGVAVCGVLAWRRARAEPDSAVAGDVAGDQVARTRFMARFATFSTGLFALVIIAEGLANLFIDPCRGAGPLTPP